MWGVPVGNSIATSPTSGRRRIKRLPHMTSQPGNPKLSSKDAGLRRVDRVLATGSIRRRPHRWSSGATFVMVMQPADVGDLNDRAAGRRLRCPSQGRVLVQRQVRPPLVIIGQELPERASKRPLVQDDHVIETLSPWGPDQAFDERILPRAACRRRDFLSATTLQQPPEGGSVTAIAVAQEVRRCRVVWKRFSDLLTRPRGGSDGQ